MTTRNRQAEVRARAGCVALTVSRETGTLAGIYRAALADMDVDGRWAVVCEDHGTLVGVDSLVMARAAAAHPTEFCDDCRAAQAAGR